MAKIFFTQNLSRHIEVPPSEAPGRTVRSVLNHVFAEHPRLRSYIVDDQHRLRQHVVVFVDGHTVHDRDRLSDKVRTDSEVHVMQALSGGV